MKKRKKYLILLSGALLFLLSGCGTSKITEQTPGIWEKFVYFFGSAIKALSLGGKIGIGIIIFTLIIRVILFPLMHFQTKAMRKTQELQPQLNKLKEKYPGKDQESRQKLNEETQKLYAESGANPAIGCLPMLVQMPILMALYQSLSRIEGLNQGTFLWLNLGKPDHLFILPVLAALFTFFSSWLSMKAAPEQNGMTKSMTYLMPGMIFLFSISVASGVSLYWTISNAFQVVQTLLINNPFALKKEREEKAQAIKEKEKAKRKALKKAMKK
ncbi:MAG: YidC/Oxa1 family membrane protein insertase [Streptococcaceae bacterium]|jgi:YidC/Oxa1 family membrane protein insertase|nr:YidC/Oxa1 family membrane protein insertase [Streptococcaceae bacterium]